MSKIFQNYVHVTDPDTLQVVVFNPGDVAPDWVVAIADPRHFVVPGDAAQEPEPATINYKKLNVDQLTDLCVDRGLDFEGTKAQLIKRLEDSDAALG